MAYFRKKPVVVEAFQMTEGRGWDHSEWPEWLSRAWSIPIETLGALWLNNIRGTQGQRLNVMTLEGPLEVSWGDWIIKGVRGELYPIKDSIFKETYEKVEE